MTNRRSKQQRLEESRALRARNRAGVNPRDKNIAPVPGAVMADPAELIHNNTYDPLPRFYADKFIQCRQCGKEEIWPAERQKWWYEVAKGNIFTQAVFCRSCRETERQRKDEARRVHLEGLAKKNAKQKT